MDEFSTKLFNANVKQTYIKEGAFKNTAASNSKDMPQKTLYLKFDCASNSKDMLQAQTVAAQALTVLKEYEQTRKEKAEAVETLQAEIDDLEASIAKLMEEITELTEAVAAIDAAVAKATKIREGEHAKNTETIKVAQEKTLCLKSMCTKCKALKEESSDAFDRKPV